MTSKTIIILSCDLCEHVGESFDVQTRFLEVERSKVELEACADCWDSFMEAARPLLRAGRKVTATGKLPGPSRLQSAARGPRRARRTSTALVTV